jgi:hypothetical protein
MVSKNKLTIALVTAALVTSQALSAGELERRQAKRIFDRLTGVNPTTATIDAMEALLLTDPSGRSAADYATRTPLTNPESAAFYNVTLKNFAAPWTNEPQTAFTPLNDYSATVIGAVRDQIDFRRILWDDLVYVGNNSPAYSMSNNSHYETLEGLDPNTTGNLSNPAILQQTMQSTVTSLPTEGTAGVMTSRAGSMAFFSDGTNRAMFRFTMMNHLCTDLEPLKDVSRTPDRVRQDVSRSPGGDSRIFLNSCVGCHAGMDGMAGAFAFYEWDYTNVKEDGTLVYTGPPTFSPGIVSGKHLINPTNFEPGYITTDDSWINYWRNGQNALLGWGTATNPDNKGNERGNGAKTLGQELANSHAFAQCQVDKVFKAVCLRGPSEFIDELPPYDGTWDPNQVEIEDREARDAIVNAFKTTYNYNLRQVFVDVAAHCKGN